MNQMLVVQIPVLNEEESIDAAIMDIPNRVDGFVKVELVIVNDGSTDGTVQKARQCGVKHIVDLGNHRGLGVAFTAGLQYGLQLGAQVIVNYDADLQYKGEEIERLVRPILENEADVVIGDRQIRRIKGYPWWKRCTQTCWSALISILFHTNVRDATSGFRALNREAAGLLVRYLQDEYTYTCESLYILARGKKRVLYVPITIRTTPRTSRLITNNLHYIRKFSVTLFRNLFRRL